MLNSDAVTRELLRGSRDGLRLGEAAKPSAPAEASLAVRLSRLTDRQLALVVGGILLVVGAWPVFLTRVPPFQDLPNHLAAVTVIQNPSAYPEFTFNGFFKTNAALFTWLHLVGKVAGPLLAAKLFALGTLSAMALVLPRFVLSFTQSRKRVVVASLFAWPMVHHWFVSMGMLDFALAMPLALGLLMALRRQETLTEKGPILRGAAVITLLGLATWYAHVFPLLVVHLLVLVEAASRHTHKARLATARALGLPLLPITLLALLSIAEHVRDAVGPMTAFMDGQKAVAPWELAYNLWAEWFWGYSYLSVTSIVPCVLLAAVGGHAVLRRRALPRAARAYPTFFSPLALVILGLLYVFMPYKMTNWFHVNSRVVPFLWIGLLLYLPESLPKRLTAILVASGLLYTAGMGADYARLERERLEFSAGIDAVPEGARLLPLLFRHKNASQNTRNLLHMWGYYVLERRTAAPLLFAHSHSFPVTYTTPPPVRFNHLVLESFAPEATSPDTVCRAAKRYDDCEQLFKSTWERFYAEATPRFDHLLLWEPTPEALAMVPKDYQRTFLRGRLMVYARSDVHR